MSSVTTKTGEDTIAKFLGRYPHSNILKVGIYDLADNLLAIYKGYRQRDGTIKLYPSGNSAYVEVCVWTIGDWELR